jgi:uncharacterized protein YicC (UPF0701 family)
VLARVRTWRGSFPGKHSIDVMDILRWPGVVREEQIDSESLRNHARALFADAAVQTSSQRARARACGCAN